jgi:3-phosphoshikimate 1-carboxyvinyltransferase
MKYCSVPSEYTGVITAPASKSYLQRAILLAALSDGESRISGYSASDDSEAVINAVNAMGAETLLDGETIIIHGGISNKCPWTFHCNESALAARMLGALSLLNENSVRITGSGSLMHRPMRMVTETLEHCGKNVVTNIDCLPFEISGPYKFRDIETDGSQTSQLLTGLLITLPLLPQNTLIRVKGLKSKPYIELTIELMQKFGLEISHDDFKVFNIDGNQKPKPAFLHAEGDWSGACFHLVGGAIAGEVTVKGIDITSRQADKAIIQALELCGADCVIQPGSVTVRKNKLLAFNFDASHCPDLFPPLATLAANCSGVSSIKGVGRLFFKESNRAEAIQQEFSKIGVRVSFTDDTMKVEGWDITGATVSSHGDHRMAMALAIMSLNSPAPVVVDGMECVRKSYPGFIKDFEELKTH